MIYEKNHNIETLESILDEIFDNFNNFCFEDIPCIPYIYKNKIRFIPMIMKEKVDNLFVVYNTLNKLKARILTKKA